MNASPERLRKKMLPLRAAATRLAGTPPSTIADCLIYLADLSLTRQLDLLSANQLDRERTDTDDPAYEVLLLTEDQLLETDERLREIAAGPAHWQTKLDALAHPSTVSVVAIEPGGWPGQLFYLFAHCLKARKAVVFLGDRHAEATHELIIELIGQALEEYELDGNGLLLPYDISNLDTILTAPDLADLVIVPQGNQARVLEAVEGPLLAIREYGVGGEALL